MDPPQPGHFWKIPFFWHPGSAAPVGSGCFGLEPALADRLLQAVASVTGASADASDRTAVDELGSTGVAEELLAVYTGFFERRQEWWQRATDSTGQHVGFTLAVLLKPQKYGREGRRQGAVYSMGTLPGLRGKSRDRVAGRDQARPERRLRG